MAEPSPQSSSIDLPTGGEAATPLWNRWRRTLLDPNKFTPPDFGFAAAFAAPDGLIVDVVNVKDPKEIATRKLEGPFNLIRFDIKMQPALETDRPKQIST